MRAPASIRTGIVACAAILMQGCNPHDVDYIAAAAITESGFALGLGGILELDGQVVKLWGYVDPRNIYANDAWSILGDWWGGEGPSPTEWRFNLKGRARDKAGNSMPVHVANDRHRNRLLRLFVADAAAGKPTRVFIQDTLTTFDAPTNFQSLRVFFESRIRCRYPLGKSQLT